MYNVFLVVLFESDFSKSTTITGRSLFRIRTHCYTTYLIVKWLGILIKYTINFIPSSTNIFSIKTLNLKPEFLRTLLLFRSYTEKDSNNTTDSAKSIVIPYQYVLDDASRNNKQKNK